MSSSGNKESEAYDFVHTFNGKTIADLSSQFQEYINSFEKSDEIRILDLGIGSGKVSFSLAKRLSTQLKDRKIIWVGVDKKESLEELINNFSLKNDLSNEEQGWKSFKIDENSNLSIFLYAGFDVESSDLSKLINNSLGGIKFDIVYAPWFFHHLIEWKKVLTRVFKALRQSGILILQFSGGMIEVYDGNVSFSADDSDNRIDHPTIKYWMTFWKEIIKNVGYNWVEQTDLSATNYKTLLDHIREFGDLWKEIPVKSIKYNWKATVKDYENVIDSFCISPLKALRALFGEGVTSLITKAKEEARKIFEDSKGLIVQWDEERTWEIAVYRKKESEKPNLNFEFYDISYDAELNSVKEWLRGEHVKEEAIFLEIKKIFQYHSILAIKDFNRPIILPASEFQNTKLLNSVLTTRLINILIRENLLPKDDLLYGIANVKLNGKFAIDTFALKENNEIFKALSFIEYWINNENESFSRYALQEPNQNSFYVVFDEELQKSLGKRAKFFSINPDCLNSLNIKYESKFYLYNDKRDEDENGKIQLPKNYYTLIEIEEKVDYKKQIETYNQWEKEWLEEKGQKDRGIFRIYLLSYAIYSKTNCIPLPVIWNYASNIIMAYQNGQVSNEIGTGAFLLATSKPLNAYLEDILKIVLDVFYSKMSIWKWKEITRESMREKGLKAAVAAIMSRNMSHNIGSHVLSSIPLEEIEKRKYDISKFNSYLQQRMDFLARISTEWPATGEYLCFYSDLMRNFLKQSLLLDKIIKDDGVEGANIKIYLKLNNSPWIGFSRQPEKHEDGNERDFSFLSTNGHEGTKKDLLIHLPGGMLGTQAFYVILENIMRNSAKYNKKSCEYEIYIEIGENKDSTGKDNDLSYKVRIYDNFSKNKNGYPLEKNGKTGTLVQLLKEKLEKDLIKNTGEIIEKDWGVQEIKIAAKFLNHPIEEKDIGISTEENDHTKKYVWVESCDREVTVKEGNDCKKAEVELASYVFSIPKAKLVLCVDHHKKEEIKKAEGKGVIAADFKEEKFVEKMKKSSPEILYFEINEGDPDKDTNRFKEVLKKIEKYKFFLPTRIVIALKKSSLDRLKEPPEKIADDYEIPPRRFVVCPLENIAEINGEDSIEKFIISVYKQWVFRWHDKELMKGEEFKNVGIVIYFDRDKKFAGFERLKMLQTDIKEDKYKLTNIKFSFFDLSQKAMEISDFDESNLTDNKIDLLMVFDNHGFFRGKFEEIMKGKKEWDFYQVIGHDISKLKMNNHSMFNLLQDVPHGFAGVMFVLSLIESAFTMVGVVDERVANWAFEEYEEKGEFEFEFPITTQNILGANLFISASVWDGDKRHQLVGKEKKPEDFRLMSEEKDQEEGISENWCRFFSMKNGLTSNFHNREIDILIIHLGFLEEIFKKDKERIEKWLDNLHKRIPKIVMISGRGYKPEEIPRGLPFREASLVINYINSDFNKLYLVKGLISPRGKY